MLSKTLILLTIVPLSIFSLAYSVNVSDGKIGIPAKQLDQDSLKVWIYLIDKGDLNEALAKKTAVSEAARIRRAMRGAVSDPTYYDLPVNEEYVSQLQPLVREIRVRSRWLNAISAYVAPENLSELAEFDFVERIAPVARYIRRPLPSEPLPELRKPTKSYQLDYGDSFGQLDQIGIVELHERGLTGAGVRILVMDTGFKISHASLSSLDIDTTWDFINGDADVEDSTEGTLAQQSHGTATLSVIGAFAPGELIGGAYNATFLLAKTERTASDSEAEMADADDWVAGIEWGELQGADIASSSLGYDTRAGYTYDDLDGNTAAVTIAADLAAALGVIVVNSVGNGGRDSAVPTLIAPSDGDSVIAVGAVTNAGGIVSFSSSGPTADGRVKPDVCAQGLSVQAADHGGDFGRKSGTSFSCPLTSAAIALMLEAHPDWEYGRVYSALTATASQAGSPDTIYGYGIIDAVAAAGDEDLPEDTEVLAYPNPFDRTVYFRVPLSEAGIVTVRLFTVAAEEVAVLEKQVFTGRTVSIPWDGLNSDGQEVTDGIYIAYIEAPGVAATTKVFRRRSGE
jgi:hypothetical protein